MKIELCRRDIMCIVNHINAALHEILSADIVHILPKIKFGLLEMVIKCLSLFVIEQFKWFTKISVFITETWNWKLFTFPISFLDFFCLLQKLLRALWIEMKYLYSKIARKLLYWDPNCHNWLLKVLNVFNTEYI